MFPNIYAKYDDRLSLVEKWHFSGLIYMKYGVWKNKTFMGYSEVDFVSILVHFIFFIGQILFASGES